MKIRKLLLLVFCTAVAVCLTGCGEAVAGVLQIQSLENIRLDENTELPYEMKIYQNSSVACENPVIIYVKDNNNEERNISFSFIVKTDDDSLTTYFVNEVTQGIIIEKNENHFGTSYINGIGDIQTFSIEIPKVEEISTLVYEINFYNNEDEV